MGTNLPKAIGRYELVEHLTGGPDGFFRARDPEGDRDVAVLLVPGELIGDATIRARVLHDAQTAAGLRHPHLAAILDVGEDPGGQLYVVTEPLRGGSLAARMASGRVSRVEALEIAVQVADALRVLHEHGLAHGSVGPDHIWLREDGTAALLLDFAGNAPLAPAALTSAGAAGRSPAYLAPEQIQGRAADARADAFALGFLLYELVAGRQPFEGDTPLAMAMRVLHDEAPAIQAIAPDVPTPLARAVNSLLQKRPEDRALDLEALRTALRVVRQQGESAPAHAPVQVAPPAPPAPVPSPGISPEPLPLAADENVQFTVYRPRILEPGTWQTMLVFAHLAEPRPDRDDEPDPAAEVARQAAAMLGDVSPYRQHTEDSAQAVPHEGDLTFVPVAEGIEFNPASRSFRWTETVHREDFRLRAQAALGNRVVHGRVTVYLGSIVLAEIGMALRVQAAGAGPREVPASDSARPYRRIFASYSHRDRAIVEEFSDYARAIGDRYLRDVVDLRSGERWEPRLEGLIREADVFQLFWSWNALDSAFVRQEWQYALSLGRDRFVRPVYWDEPLPARGDLPPAALRQLHFQQIRPMRRLPASEPAAPSARRTGDTGAHAAVPAPASPAPAPSAPAPPTPSPLPAAPAPLPSAPAPGDPQERERTRAEQERARAMAAAVEAAKRVIEEGRLDEAVGALHKLEEISADRHSEALRAELDRRLAERREVEARDEAERRRAGASQREEVGRREEEPDETAHRETLEPRAPSVPRAREARQMRAPSRLASWRGMLAAAAALAVIAIMLPTWWLTRQGGGSTNLPSNTPPTARVNPTPTPPVPEPSADMTTAGEADRLWQRGETTAALTVIRRAVDQAPADPAVQAQLARMQADAEQRLANARRAAEGIAPPVSLAQAAAHERRAAAAAREGRRVDAIAQLVAAAEVVERDGPATERGARRRPDGAREPARNAAPP